MSIRRYLNGLKVINELLSFLKIQFDVGEEHAKVIINDFANVVYHSASTTDDWTKLERVLVNFDSHSESG